MWYSRCYSFCCNVSHYELFYCDIPYSFCCISYFAKLSFILFVVLVVLLWHPLLYLLYQLSYCIIFYFIRSISCPAVVLYVILYYKSCSTIISFVVITVTIILLWLYVLHPTYLIVSILSKYWACLCTS